MFIWPSTIVPLPSFSFTIDSDYANIRSKMASGRTRQRKVNDDAEHLIQAQFSLNRTEWATFVGIWRQHLNNGVDWFLMDIPQPDNTSLTQRTVRFISDLSQTHQSYENWTVRAVLEIKGLNELTANELATILDGTPSIDRPAMLIAVLLSGDDATISWTDYVDEESYEVQRSTDGATWYQIATPVAGSTSHIDTGLTAGQQYFYRARPIFTGEVVPWSNIVGVIYCATEGILVDWEVDES